MWLKNRANLTAKQRETLAWLTRPSSRLATARAHRWREDFQAFYDEQGTDLRRTRHRPTTNKAPTYDKQGTAAEAYLRRWRYGAKRSRLQPVKDVVEMVENHWDGVPACHQNRVTNNLLEDTSSLVQATESRARGYRNKK